MYFSLVEQSLLAILVVAIYCIWLHLIYNFWKYIKDESRLLTSTLHKENCLKLRNNPFFWIKVWRKFPVQWREGKREKQRSTFFLTFYTLRSLVIKCKISTFEFRKIWTRSCNFQALNHSCNFCLKYIFTKFFKNNV